jgi:hypothetical protein
VLSVPITTQIFFSFSFFLPRRVSLLLTSLFPLAFNLIRRYSSRLSLLFLSPLICSSSFFPFVFSKIAHRRLICATPPGFHLAINATAPKRSTYVAEPRLSVSNSNQTQTTLNFFETHFFLRS